MDIGAIERRKAAVARQPQMRFEYQSPQDVAQAAIREIAAAEGGQHPIVEAVQSWIEKVVVWFERRSLEPAFRLKLGFQRSSRIGQGSAEIRHAPPVADKRVEEIDVGHRTLERRIRLQQHEAEIEG